MSYSLHEVLEEVYEWQKATFPHATPQSIANHLFSEVTELKVDPTAKEEIADVLMLVAALAHWQGFDLAQICKGKLEINRLRKWGEVNSEGYVEHVREEIAVEKKMDWVEAERHLKELEEVYGNFPQGGFAIHYLLKPARARFDSGERTPDLYAEIMEL